VKTEPDAFGFDDLWRARRPVDAVGRRSQLPGPQLPARRHARRRHRRHLPLERDAAGRAGLAVVASAPYPDATQFDPASPYHDPTSTPEAPRWWSVDVRATARLPRLVTLAELRADPVLAGLDLALLRRGNRLSVMPLPLAALDRIEELARA
jgi:hypothetical protein